jgi:integrase
MRALTDVAIRNMKPSASRREVPDPGQRGLYVIVQPSGAKSFAVRYRHAGRPHKLTLKAGITLAAARKEAASALYDVEQGRDPSVTKRDAKQAHRLAAENTFRAVAEQYQKLAGAHLRSAKHRRSMLERLVYPTLGDRPIAEIRRSEITRLLDKIEEGKPLGVEGGSTAADRALRVIGRIMNWYATRSDDFVPPIVRGMARTSSKERARTRILTDDELRRIWRTAVEGSDTFGALVRFLLLTAARRNEAAYLTWSELAGGDWTLPVSRNKTKEELVRPLSKAALAVLDLVPKFADCDFVFSSGSTAIGGLSRRKLKLDTACGVSGWTLHDLRRTARSLMSRAGVNSDHAEQCLGHVITGVKGVYDRHQYHAEKARAYEALAAQIERIVNPPADNVTSISEHKTRA